MSYIANVINMTKYVYYGKKHLNNISYKQY